MTPAPATPRRIHPRGYCRRLPGLLCILLGAPALSQDAPADFDRCLARIGDQAVTEGVSESVVAEVLPTLRFQPRVLELDRAQPETTQSFSAYLKTRVSDRRIGLGRSLLVRHQPLLAALTERYGVPAQYLVAIWGLETNFGRYLGTMPTLDSLATLACDARRGPFFTRELVTALKLLEREGLDPAELRGSWAGALGHTQFMPTAYLEHAVDGDGDGRADLLGSIPDALASGASYLQSLGWRSGERWGREVRLPDDFPWAESGIGGRRPLAAWSALGVRRADGAVLPAAPIEGAVLVPMGHAGPAFLAYPNFDVLMRWNRSQSYALAVGHLADRLAGAGPLRAVLPAIDSGPTRGDIRTLQEQLIAYGFEPGEADGFLGPQTRSALRAFQLSRGLRADGYPDEATLAALGDRGEDPAAGDGLSRARNP